MLQWLYMFIASFCSQWFTCFSIRMLQVCLFRCCICFTHMLQVFYLNVAYVFQVFFMCFCKCLKCMFEVFHLPSDICCKCCIWMLHIFAMTFQVFSDVFASVLDACFKCFICIKTYVANISFGCYKSRLGVVHVAMVPVAGWPPPSPCPRTL